MPTPLPFSIERFTWLSAGLLIRYLYGPVDLEIDRLTTLPFIRGRTPDDTKYDQIGVIFGISQSLLNGDIVALSLHMAHAAATIATHGKPRIPADAEQELPIGPLCTNQSRGGIILRGIVDEAYPVDRKKNPEVWTRPKVYYDLAEDTFKLGDCGIIIRLDTLFHKPAKLELEIV